MTEAHRMAICRQAAPDKSAILAALVIHHQHARSVPTVGASDLDAIKEAAGVGRAVRQDKSGLPVGLDDIDAMSSDPVESPAFHSFKIEIEQHRKCHRGHDGINDEETAGPMRSHDVRSMP